MRMIKCPSCERRPQNADQFIDKFDRPCSTCLKCRLRTNRNRKPKNNTRKCDHCSRQPSFNFPGSTPGVRCSEHREPGMVNVVQINCRHDGCMKQPCYNLPNEHFGKFCVTHKTLDMVNVRERTCEAVDCTKKPVYNLSNELRGRFCKAHKHDDMIDVISYSCADDNCNKRATFNYYGQKAKFCSAHKDVEMIDVKTKRCEYENCSTVPVFNFSGNKGGRFCFIHKHDGMTDVKNKRCKTMMCDIIITGLNEYCSRCTSYLFPHKPSRFKTREMKLKDFLECEYPTKTITHDKRVDCHLYRPDFVFDMGSHVVVIELDENQHRNYDTSCDNKRLMSIFKGLGSRPMIMLRFNPDRYDSVPGCFKKDGLLMNNGREWNLRTVTLKKRIDFWLNTQVTREITLEHLFFDSK